MPNYLKGHSASFSQSTECLCLISALNPLEELLKGAERRAHNLILVEANGRCRVLGDRAVRDADFSLKYASFVYLPNLSLSPPSSPSSLFPLGEATRLNLGMILI